MAARNVLFSRLRNCSKITSRYAEPFRNDRIFFRCSTNDQSDRCNSNLDLENNQRAFDSKTNTELVRALTVLGLCSSQTLVNNSMKLWEILRKCTGETVCNATLRKTFYEQFVGGDTPEQMVTLVDRLSQCNIEPMIVCTMEEDIGESHGEDMYDRNVRRLLDCLKLISSFKSDAPLMQVKVTSIISPNVLVSISEMLRSSANGKLLNMVKAIVDHVSQKKPLVMDSLKKEEMQMVQNGMMRLITVAQEAQDRNIRLLVDAEYTYVNPGISLMTLSLMALFNQTAPLISNTYQCYLKDAISNLRSQMDIVNKLGVCFGLKLVRGAYIDLETDRATTMGTDMPIWNSYEETCACYNKAVDILLEAVRESGSRILVILATHNEDSILRAYEKIDAMNLSKNELECISFAQLYGMCDQITYPLASSGMRVYKSIPYGPLTEALPYLARRASENKTIFTRAKKERSLLMKALKSRLKPGILSK